MQFEAFPKIPRLKRELVITEKIDGTNAQVYIREKNEYLADMGASSGMGPAPDAQWLREVGKAGAICVIAAAEGTQYIIRAGSRNRFLTPQEDNYGFWQWVNQNAGALVGLGVGRHFGEWWGLGIQRGYGLSERRFSLFNTARWGSHNPNTPGCCSVVPVLRAGATFEEVNLQLESITTNGSRAAPGFMDPEGIVVFHKASRSLFKVTCKDDESPKGKAS